MKKMNIALFVLGMCICLYSQQKSLDTYLKEAQLLKKDGKGVEAVLLLREAVSVYPNDPSAHLELGLACGESGRSTSDMTAAMNGIVEAFAEFDKAIALDPKNIDAHMFNGIYGVNVPQFFGKLDPGVAHLETARTLLEKQPLATAKDKLASVCRFLGKGYEMQNRSDLAKLAWEKVLDLAPAGENGDAAKAGLEELKKREAEAAANAKKEEANQDLSSLKKRLEQSPRDINLWIQLGNVYSREKKWSDAVDAFRRAVEIDSNRADVQLMMVIALGADVQTGYDERIYRDQNVRTNLAFEYVGHLQKAYRLDPGNPVIKLWYAVSCVQMPFFVDKMDQGLAMLDEMAKNENLPDSIRAQALYQLGFGYRKKGTAAWMQLVKNFPNSGELKDVYDEFGTREYRKEAFAFPGEKVLVTFHLGFKDELEPQTGVWVEDGNGKFIRTLYVSGFAGYAKEKQVNLPEWAKQSKYETDGTTGASIDWGRHTYLWDLKDAQGKRVKDGLYRIKVEAMWWPSMQYGLAAAEIKIGKTPSEATVEEKPFIPFMQVIYKK